MNYLYQFFVLLVVLLQYCAEGKDKPDVTGSTQGNKQVAQAPTKSDKELEVVQLTSRNFGKAISDGNVWLVEFYSPNCHHCVEFSPTYSDIAHHYHSNPDKKIKVGKVSGDIERALTSRFAIYAYPSFFLIDGWSVYQFQESRIKKNMMTFAEGGYKATDAIPFYASPMGPMGIMQGFLIATGHNLSDFFGWVQVTFGLSPIFVAMIVFGSLFVGGFVGIVLLALAIPPRQVKHD